MVRIGITSGMRDGRHILEDTYVRAVRAAGGVAVLLPAVPSPRDDELAAYLDGVDGLVLSGGGDVDPSYYGGTPHPTLFGLDGARDQVELALVQKAAARGIPLLGICRGIQVLNVALGGDLVPDIPSVVGDKVPHAGGVHHPVRVTGGMLAPLLGEELEVHSSHHQAVAGIAPGLRAAAWAPDGVVEAVEGEGLPLVGVQWHPERTLDEGAEGPSWRLFRWLVTEAQRRRAGHR